MAVEAAASDSNPDAHPSGIKGLVNKLRRHSLSFTPKGSQSDLHNSGYNSPRKTSSQRTSTSDLGPVGRSPTRDAPSSLDIWNSAYDALRDDPTTAGLVLAYESIISHELPEHLKTDGMNMSFRGRSDDDRLRLLAAITRAGLNKRRGSKTSQSDDLARSVIEASKDAIDPLMPSYSSTAVAWAGICTMTPLLLDPILRLEHLRVGILHVLGRVSWYMTLTRLLFSDEWDNEETFRSHQHDLREKIQRQYRRVLEFEMNCVCASASGWNPAAKNVVSWNALAKMVSAIQDNDDELFNIARDASTKHNMTQLYKDLELPSPSDTSGSEIEPNIAGKKASATAA